MSETEVADVAERAAAHFMPKEDVSEHLEAEQPQTEDSEQPEIEASEEVSEESQTEEAAQPEYEEVEFEGETYRVPPKLKDAFMAKNDYTAKTTETARLKETLALQQKEVALFQEARAFHDSIAEDVDNLKMLDAYIAHEKQQLVNGLDGMDSNQLVRKQLELGQYEDQKKQLERVLREKQAEFNSKIVEERNRIKEAAQETLKKSIPTWNDDVRESVEKDLISRGYPETAVQNMGALDYQVAWEAAQYRKLKSGTADALKKASQTPPVVKAGPSNPMPKDVKDKLKFQKQLAANKKAQAPEGETAKIIQQRLEQKFRRFG